MIRRIALAFAGLVATGAVLFLWLAWWPAIDPVDPPQAASFDRTLIRHGAELAAIGDCAVCHTASRGKVFAGGLPLQTPFGTIYSTNITPDPDTGIGRWSEAAFRRAMRDGVDRAGRQLYPAFPYDHFTRVTDEDDSALYAYLMTREPVKADTPANTLPFPINVRLVLAGWKALFFRPGAYVADAAHDAVWNRGAYLVDGLGHCGACHTPRNDLGAEKTGEMLAGGVAEGWQAYALNAASPAPVPWTANSLDQYLRQGWHQQHGVARGPMAAVATSLGIANRDDVRAMATYIAAGMGNPDEARRTRAAAVLAATGQTTIGRRPQEAGQQAAGTTPAASEGAQIYQGACASCHESDRPQPFGGLDFHLSSAVNAPRPTNIVNVVLNGLPAAEGERSAIMPGFAGVLTDPEIAALLTYLRVTYSDKPAWADVQDEVTATRRAGAASHSSGGTEHAPTNVSQLEQKP